MLCYSGTAFIEQRCNRFLCAPNGFICIHHLDAVLLALGNEGEELCRAISYLKFLCHNRFGPIMPCAKL